MVDGGKTIVEMDENWCNCKENMVIEYKLGYNRMRYGTCQFLVIENDLGRWRLAIPKRGPFKKLKAWVILVILFCLKDE